MPNDPRNFWTFNTIYRSCFGAHPPARARVQSAMTVGCKVEIGFMAHKDPI